MPAGHLPPYEDAETIVDGTLPYADAPTVLVDPDRRFTDQPTLPRAHQLHLAPAPPRLPPVAAPVSGMEQLFEQVVAWLRRALFA